MHTDQGEIMGKGKQHGRDQRRKASRKTKVRSKGRANNAEGIKGGKLVDRPGRDQREGRAVRQV